MYLKSGLSTVHLINWVIPVSRKLFLLTVVFLYICDSNGQSVAESRSSNFPQKQTKVIGSFPKEDVWIFIMAGQSNMAGRGSVEPTDTLINSRVFTLNSSGELIYAQEPLHWYEPDLTGLDCGMSFARTLLDGIPEDKKILLVPTAIGGSSMNQWLLDQTHRGVPLLTNFRKQVHSARQYGIIKGILWHQGESDASTEGIAGHYLNLKQLFGIFREEVNDLALPVFIAELGSFSEHDELWQGINKVFSQYVNSDANSYLIKTGDLSCKEDLIHFDSKSQREMGRRFAEKFLSQQ